MDCKQRIPSASSSSSLSTSPPRSRPSFGILLLIPSGTLKLVLRLDFPLPEPPERDPDGRPALDKDVRRDEGAELSSRADVPGGEALKPPRSKLGMSVEEVMGEMLYCVHNIETCRLRPRLSLRYI